MKPYRRRSSSRRALVEGQLSARLDAAAGVLVFGRGEPALVADGGQRAGRGAGSALDEAAAAVACAGAATTGPSSSLAWSPLAARLQEELESLRRAKRIGIEADGVVTLTP